NMAFVAALAGLFTLKFKLIYFLITVSLSTLFIVYARKKQSYLYILMGVIYGYIALTYIVFHSITDEALFEYVSIYFMFSAGLVIVFLLKVKEFVKAEK
ncbi:MAG: DUF2157 domain-containing protein, partial [Spirosomaceae bacterium]|nr:DUF2157 domain-containing protein [Spirosomataceae bacterium]